MVRSNRVWSAKIVPLSSFVQILLRPTAEPPFGLPCSLIAQLFCNISALSFDNPHAKVGPRRFSIVKVCTCVMLLQSEIVRFTLEFIFGPYRAPNQWEECVIVPKPTAEPNPTLACCVRYTKIGVLMCQITLSPFGNCKKAVGPYFALNSFYGRFH